MNVACCSTLQDAAAGGVAFLPLVSCQYDCRDELACVTGKGNGIFKNSTPDVLPLWVACTSTHNVMGFQYGEH